MQKFARISTTQFLLAVTCFTFVMAGQIVMATQANADDRDTTTKVSGVIAQIRSGFIFVTTSWGLMMIQSDALANAVVGDEITVWVNENNVVIDAYPKGNPRTHHRWIRGKLTYTSSDRESL